MLFVAFSCIYMFAVCRLVCCLSRHFDSPCIQYWSMHTAYVSLSLSVFYISQSTSTFNIHTSMCVSVCGMWIIISVSVSRCIPLRSCEWVSEYVYLWCIKGENAKAACHRKYAVQTKTPTYRHRRSHNTTHEKYVWLWLVLVMWDRPTYILVKPA